MAINEQTDSTSPMEDSLFDLVPEWCPLHVVHDGNPEIMGFEDLFGSGRYNDLKAVSYVSSPSFLSKTLRWFDTAEIILGIDSPQALAAIRDLVSGANVRFYNGLSDEVRDKVAQGVVSVRYSNMCEVIHSKIYLLANEAEGNFRTIVGSVNLTQNALKRGRKAQYEEAVVFDGPEMYGIYSKRFSVLHTKTVDYLPEAAKREWESSRALLAVDDPAVLSKAIREGLATGDAKVAFTGATAEYEELKRRADEGDQDLSRADENLLEIVKAVARTSKDTLALKSEPQLEKVWAKKVEPRILSLACEAEAKDLALPFVVEGDDSEGRRALFLARATSSDGRSIDGRQLLRGYSTTGMAPEEADAALANIEAFLGTFHDFTVAKVGDEYLSWIYEAILYTMTAPVLMDVRARTSEEYGENQLPNMPIYLAIGGRQGSGKSGLLEYLWKLMTGEDAHVSELQYSVAKTDCGPYLQDYFKMGSRFPLLVDEAPKKIFRNAGGEHIKSATNVIPDFAYGPIVCTTNAEDYQPDEGASRRVKYLPLDKVFDRGNLEGQKTYQEIVSACTGRLEGEFLGRWLEAFDAGSEVYAMSDSSPDSLVLSRRILLEIYRHANREVPSFFPLYPIDNTTIEGKRRWSQLWGDEEQRGKIIPMDDGERLRIRVETLFENKPTKAELETYTKSLPPQVAEKSTGMYLVLNTEQFFMWIGAENPYASKGNRWSKIKNWFAS